MCGRFVNASSVEKLVQEFEAVRGVATEWVPSYSIAPTASVPIVKESIRDGGPPRREVVLGVWNFPQPANSSRRAPIINARREKLGHGFWVGPFSQSRCIVPMDGYFEWNGTVGDKQPHYVHGRGLLAAAGVSTTRLTEAGVWVRRFAIITGEARDAAGTVHDRMPLFLTPDLWDDWLDTESLTTPGNSADASARRDELLARLDASAAVVSAQMLSYPVDRKINSVRSVDPRDASNIRPVDLPG